CQQGYDTPATF
nr:immunoglobulin light chain junction region [Macaca mulatta]MOX48068.1 immunoglobulin light chain junction region [Macaca mulatta]MOX48617.1 immunoglobulin light chain junction region [Macaca mulatta]